MTRSLVSGLWSRECRSDRNELSDVMMDVKRISSRAAKHYEDTHE
jgi:hypothetical protein